MTLFEYIAIAFSMVFSFTVLRLVGGLPSAIRPRRMYWPQLLFTLTALFYVLNAFWAFWSYSNVEWTYAKYLLGLTSPAAQYFTVAILVPSEPNDVQSWKQHYFATRVRFFVGLILMTLVGALSTTALAEMPLDHPARFGQLATLVIGGIGLATANPKVHAALSVISLVGVVAFGALILSQPGGLA